MNRIRSVELWLKAWWCDMKEHRWIYRDGSKGLKRLCLRCGRRESWFQESGRWDRFGESK